jgi:hypothetical protein
LEGRGIASRLRQTTHSSVVAKNVKQLDAVTAQERKYAKFLICFYFKLDVIHILALV